MSGTVENIDEYVKSMDGYVKSMLRDVTVEIIGGDENKGRNMGKVLVTLQLRSPFNEYENIRVYVSRRGKTITVVYEKTTHPYDHSKGRHTTHVTSERKVFPYGSMNELCEYLMSADRGDWCYTYFVLPDGKKLNTTLPWNGDSEYYYIQDNKIAQFINSYGENRND